MYVIKCEVFKTVFMQNTQSFRVANNLFSMAQEPQSGLGRHVFTSDRISHTIRHTQMTPSRTPLNEWSARLRDRHIHKDQTRETYFLATKRPQIYTLDRAITRIGLVDSLLRITIRTELLHDFRPTPLDTFHPSYYAYNHKRYDAIAKAVRW